MLFIGFTIAACNPDRETSNKTVTTRYVAYSKGDTAIATLVESPSLFKGVLEIRYEGSYKDSGDVRGFIKGDTLMGDYHYQSYWLPIWKRKPVIFLRRNGNLVLGKGIVKFTMGIPHYNPSYPVEYDESKSFVFKKLEN